MNLIRPSTVEDRIVRILLNGPEKATSLLDRTAGVTKQGFYAALRKLRKEEVVVVYKGIASLNTTWVQQLNDIAARALNVYLPEAEAAGVLSLKERESVSYSFADTKHLDAFWGHTQNILVAQTPATEPVFSYDPHYWFYIARKDTEQRLIDAITDSGKQFLMTVGGSTRLDKELRKEFADDSRQYHMKRIFPHDNYYAVVIGTYVTEVWLDRSIGERIELIYQSNEDDSALRAQLERLLTVKGRHKVRISRNTQKAKKLKTKLSKNFFVRK